MATNPIPNIDELKESSGSNQLNECFQFLFVHEHNELEAFFMDINGKRKQLRSKIEKHDQTLREAKSFGPFHGVATDGHGFLMETQIRYRRMLEALTAILVEVREAITEKKHHILLMEYDDNDV